MTAGKQERNNTHSLSRWVAALAVVMCIPLIAGFNARMTIIQQMNQEERQLARGIAEEQARRAELEKLHAFVKSDAYVEYWAREEARMAYPGEVAIIPVPQESSPPAPTPVPIAQQSTSPLGDWWAVFFDSSPALW